MKSLYGYRWIGELMVNYKLYFYEKRVFFVDVLMAWGRELNNAGQDGIEECRGELKVIYNF